MVEKDTFYINNTSKYYNFSDVNHDDATHGDSSIHEELLYEISSLADQIIKLRVSIVNSNTFTFKNITEKKKEKMQKSS